MTHSARGGRLENSVTKKTYALICQEHVKNNVKIAAAKQLGTNIVKREWIDHLIVYVVTREQCDG